MLRKRSRAVTSKQALMADNVYLPSPKDKYIKPTTSPFTLSPRLFTGLSSNGFSESDSVNSPTSILDNKHFSNLGNPFWSDKNTTTKSWEKKLDSGVGLGIIDALIDEKPNQKFSNPSSRMVLFGSQLKIQIPPLPSSIESPKSQTDFGINTRTPKLGSQVSSPSSTMKSPFGPENSPMVFTGCLSATEMESSEDYTCVITHGPNPKTTHIFDNCIVKNCCGVVGFSSPKKEKLSLSDKSDYPSKNFLSFCYTCKKNLEQGKDIYMYRGEKAFCSHECRNQEILFDEGMEKSGFDSSLRTCS
ncbi:Protein of unknown function DUF581 [Macleaya cordata]|uniref:FLZ-type domain-containing protein n=1 Tax=Macleaya cordata TaxID=56857 RepID=A0A200Q4M9_MACCD|nr:Protein of unknown function DUF581 [Macleaya cordata]